MGFLRKKRPAPGAAVSTGLQTGRREQEPFALASYDAQGTGEERLYGKPREAVPLIDAAIHKIVRLTGGFTVTCKSRGAERELQRFLEEVNVNGNQQGVQAFLSTYLEQLLTYGTAVGEIVPSPEGGIAALYNAPLRDIALRPHPSRPVEIEVCRREPYGEPTPVRRPELILLSVLNPEPGRLWGVSLLRGLPFVSGILLKIYHAMGQNWERVGNVRFAVTYKPQNDGMDKAYAKERAMEIAREWSCAMSDSGQVRDFVAVGDVNVKVIGADNQVLDSDVPVRQMLEQIVAKTGIPPFLLGLSWSSTERMSAQQADVLTSELHAYRRILTPVILKIAGLWLRLSGYGGEVQVEWDDITLLDEVETGKARYYRAQARALEMKTGDEEETE